jgi:predicted dehydrogenase
MGLRIGIVGAGLIGNKRAEAIADIGQDRIIGVADIDIDRAKTLAAKHSCRATADSQGLISSSDVDVVVVATVNKHLAPITIAAIKNGKHVLCEKPLGRNADEADLMVQQAKQNAVILKTGFNHRCHPAIAKAKQLTDKGEIGRIMFLRCRYGHGGRPGYEREWRADKDLCGGGELLDQGVHVVDLFRWFAGDFNEAFGYTQTCFWNMQVEDNAFAMFKNKAGVIATMHTSWTQWKNLFSFEVFGDLGYLIIDGLGGSYGVETLKFGRRNPKGGPPDEQIEQFTGPDVSWRLEWTEFTRAIDERRQPVGNGIDGWQANRMIEAVQRSAREKRAVEI